MTNKPVSRDAVYRKCNDAMKYFRDTRDELALEATTDEMSDKAWALSDSGVLDSASVSKHNFRDEIRDGHLMMNGQDRLMIELLGRIRGREVANEYMTRVQKAPEFRKVIATLDLYRVISEAVIYEHWDGQPFDMTDFFKNMYRPEFYALQLFGHCARASRELRSHFDESSQQELDMFIVNDIANAYSYYHRMIVSLIERGSLTRMKEGAKGRSTYSDEVKNKVLAYAIAYYDKQAKRVENPSIHAAANHAIEQYKSSDKAPENGKYPSIRTVTKWINQHLTPQ